MQDYEHFVVHPEPLNTQLDSLIPLHGKEKITKWQVMALSGDMETLVNELLAIIMILPTYVPSTAILCRCRK